MDGWMPLSCKCYVLSGRGLYNGPITHPEESYQTPEFDLETSGGGLGQLGLSSRNKNLWKIVLVIRSYQRHGALEIPSIPIVSKL